ncbi:putative glycoside hydrolase [Clostridium boliviensis]|uniref:Glycoside hydrolase n=2 Tax=Clostridium boliviensis TaxID=318465 RepID=A0ABU4GIL4_9CLOT|nr:putative glycoside hydrolase [Clostridium boliviensis]MDW2797455.1 putative glycoside hydrolase [Clostridium boliviensis]
MKRWLLAVIVCSLVAAGCGRYKELPETIESGKTSDEVTEDSSESTQAETVGTSVLPQKKPVKVKGIYISGYMAGSEGFQAILDKVKGTEINAVVIDVKNDDGRITFAMDDAPTVKEIGAEKKYIRDMPAMMAQLKERGIYTIARVVAFRDPYLAEQKPEWSLKNKDGSLHRDNQGLAWVNPYCPEVWDYLVEVGEAASEAGFDEVQFDYIRFSTDSSMKQVAFDENETKGRSKTDIITEFIQYAYEKLSARNITVSADVFGTIIGSNVDAQAVGQVYSDMADHLDYICPMIYPSHYGDGNFGIDHPDTKPYDTIRAALNLSKSDLEKTRKDGASQAIVRPWLQDFTASYLKHHISYGKKEVRDQIKAVYDAGYDEWILWSASNRYTWDALLSEEEAKEEAEKIARLRATEEEESKAAAEAKAEAEAKTAVETKAAAETKPVPYKVESQAEKSLEGSVAAEETAAQESQAGEESQKSKKRSKPPVVIVTTGGSRNEK